MLNKRVYYILFAFSLFAGKIQAQKAETIKLDNPSFEDYPNMAHPPQGWLDCGFAGESATDIQPGSFQVTRPAQNGKTYVGLVTRDVNTWEAIGQKLKSPLLKGTEYKFSIYACRSELYMSQSQLTRKEVNYVTPTVLRIWGCTSPCSKGELLGETTEISNATWQKFDFIFKPKSQYEFISFEVFYKTPTLFPYNGNLMIDNASDIVPEKKQNPAVVAQIKTKTKPIDTPKPRPIPVTPDPNAIASEKSHPKIIEPAVPEQKTKIVEGKILRIENLQFETQSAVIDAKSFTSLDQMYDFLSNNQNLVVEIGGHTNLIIDEDSGKKLSYDRAQAVADYFVTKGIDRKRFRIKGYGKTQPIVNAITPDANRRNQRVEIKILSTNG